MHTKDVASAIEPVLQGNPRAVDVAAIESELSSLWRSAAEDPALKNAVMRACALTLIIYVESEESAQEVGELIADVTRQNPCRAIVMIVEPDADSEGLEAWISAHCHLPTAGEKQVCSEQVTLRARGEAVGNLSSVVLPLTVSGLPVHFWWRAGRFSPPPYFHQILRITSHVIIDSARFPNPPFDLEELRAWIDQSPGAPVVTDLNWARLTPWRSLIAQCFDPPERRSYLSRLTEVRVEFEKESPRVTTQRTQGLLLAGWLASRLNWDFLSHDSLKGTEGDAYIFKAEGRTLEVQLVPQEFKGAGSGVCYSIELWADGLSPAVFSFERGADGKAVQTRATVPGAQPIGRTVRLEVLSEVEILNDELKLGRRDHVYEETLRMVARMTAGRRK